MNVEQAIFVYLENGAKSKSDLINHISSELEVSIQAVYKSLRHLRSSGTVVEHKNMLSFSMWHIENERKRWSKISIIYDTKLFYGDFIFLEPGKKFIKYFDTYSDLDRYWVTAFLLIEKILPQNIPSYTVMPHDWYVYAHIESDMYWSKNHKQNQRLIITNPFQADKLAARVRRQNGYKVTYGVNPFQQNDSKHFSIVGGWIFEVDFDKQFTENLVQIIEPLTDIDKVDLTQINNLIKKKGKFKMSIYHNESKSAEMIKKIKKYFE